MTSITPVLTKDACPVFGPYNQAVKTPHAIYVSGQLPALPTGELPSDISVGEKTRLCLKNLEAILKESGSELSKVVKVVVFLTDMKNFAEVNAEYESWFTKHKPARSCVAVHQLPKGVEVEIECVALP